MSDRIVARLSLLISLMAVGYAVWLDVHADEIATEALRRREKAFVEAMAPKFRLIWADMGDSRTFKSEPQTLEELVAPLVGIMDELGSPINHPINHATPKLPNP